MMAPPLRALLVAFTRDVGGWTPQETLEKMRELKLHVVADARACVSSHDVAKRLGTWASALATGVRHGLLQLPADGTRRRDQWLDATLFLLEDAVMTAYHTLRENAVARDLDATASYTVHDSRVAFGRLRDAFARVLVASSTPVAVAWTHVAVLLAVSWTLEYQGKRSVASSSSSLVTQATELLEVVGSHWRGRDEPLACRSLAWALFLQGLLRAVCLRDASRARRCLQEAAELAAREAPDLAMGPVFYWYAVLLSSETETLATETASEQLRLAVASNYRAVESLNLQALLAIQRGDLHEAATALERSVDIDFDAAVSMFNYAVLLQRLGNREAQYQMLAYYGEATAKRSDHEDEEPADNGGKKRVKTSTGDRVGLFNDEELARLFPCPRREVGRGELALQMAMAATATGAWQDARERFDDYFAEVEAGGAVVSVTTRRMYIYVLLQCNRPTAALKQCDLATPEDLWVEFYRADALLCLERVEECESHLKHVIEPRLTARLERQDLERNDELVGLHIQLLNNLAVATVCRGDLDAAVAMLRDCSRLYPDDLSVQFNLTLLLWRLGRHEAACALWFKARGWSLRMDVGDMREQQKALDFVARIEDEALSRTTQPKVHAHVSDAAPTSGAVDDHQLRYLDALVLNYWGNAQDSLVAKTAAQYVEYLEALQAKSSNGNR